MAVEFSYQIQYELCSLFFLCCIAVQFFVSKRFPTITGSLFSTILLVSIADLTLDVIGSVAVNNINTFPVWLNYLVNAVFYCLQIVLPMLMTIYVIYSIGFTLKNNTAFILILAPAAVFLIIQAINPFTGLMFSIEGEPGHLEYVTGPMSVFLYVCAAFYMISILVLGTIHSEKLTTKQIGTIMVFTILTTTAMVFQVFHPSILMTGTAITVSLLLWDLTLQNPEDMIDAETRTFDADGLRLFLARELSRSQVHAAVIEIDGLSATERGEGEMANSLLMQQIGSFFTHLTPNRSWAFRDSKTRFWVAARNDTELEAISNKIVNRFLSVWDVEGLNVDLMAKVLYFSTKTSLKMSPSELMSIIDESIDMDNVIARQKTSLTIDSGMLAKYRRRNILEESMRKSIVTGEGFYICFQPIVYTDKPEYTAAEVLLRFNDENLGAVSPAEFMPIVESRGLSVFIDNYVVDNACRFLAAHPEIDLLHLNISASEFYSNPAKRIIRTVSDHGVDSSRICLEITESTAARNPDILKAFMDEMIEQGFSFALDDYGTGYSNALQVMKMPFKTVKIDRSLLDEESRSRKFLDGTIKIFLDLGIEPLIEGIETKQQLDLVTKLGASLMQGFFFSPPLVDEDYMAFVRNGNKATK